MGSTAAHICHQHTCCTGCTTKRLCALRGCSARCTPSPKTGTHHPGERIIALTGSCWQRVSLPRVRTLYTRASSFGLASEYHLLRAALSSFRSCARQHESHRLNSTEASTGAPRAGKLLSMRRGGNRVLLAWSTNALVT